MKEKGILGTRKKGKDEEDAVRVGKTGGTVAVGDLRSLEAALLSLSEEPPHVARSTPKGVRRDPVAAASAVAARNASCVAPPEVYDQMLAASLDACAQLQNSLDSYIGEVRSAPATRAAPSPVPPNLPLTVHMSATDGLAALPPSDSGHGTSLDGNDSISPVPNHHHDQDSPRESSPPAKSVSFKDIPHHLHQQPPSNKRRVIRMVNF